MPLSVIPVTAGNAHQALAAAVRDAKAGDVLRPVTVLVPTNAAGVIARRALGRLGGVAAVDFVTIYRLAERLAGPALRAEDRLPVSTAVVDIAVRKVLSSNTTAFDAVAEHPSTAVALRELHRELRLAGPDAVERLERSSSRGRDVARVSRLVSGRLDRAWYDEGDLLTHSIAAIGSDGLPPSLSLVVVFLPQAFSSLERRLVERLAEHGDVRVLLEQTGEPDADGDLESLADELGKPLGAAPPRLARTATEIVSVTDADEEVRHAVRVIVEAARAGTPLAEIAVLWPTDRPYARLVEHHLDTAGIAWNGRPGNRVSERLVPRFLLDLLDVDRRGLRRRDLFELLADVPVRDASGRRAGVSAWERVSREAGVVKDDQWTPRLRAYAALHRRRAAERRDPDGDLLDESAEPISRTADAADALADFVIDLRRDLGSSGRTRPWQEWATWAVDQIERRIGVATLQNLDEAERQAWEHTTRVLDRMSQLDAIGDPPTRSQFRSVFAAEFDVAPGRLGRIGAGVTIGSLPGAVGLAPHLVIVVGAADGLMPAPPTIDPLISDSDRLAAGLTTSDAVNARSHRQFLGVLDAATRVVVTTPRGDLRTTTVRLPSRWLAALGDTPTTVLASHASALAATSFPAHATEHRLRHRAALVAQAGPAALATEVDRSVDDTLWRALRLRAARRLDTLTEFDGDLSGAGVPMLDQPVSPTQIQTWAACPHAYFVQYLLGVRELEEPADSLAITPADRGNALHDVLDAFHREVIAGSLPQPAEEGWTDVHIGRLTELMNDTADRFERTGRTGRSAYWAVDRQQLAAELHGWVVTDSQTAIARRSHVVASEQRFGSDAEVAIPLPGGRRLFLRGSVDRVDRTSQGLVITDHKTGKPDKLRKVTRADPTLGRTMFQLPAYAAAAVAFGEPGSGTVRAEYSFFARGKYRRFGYEFDTEVWDTVGADVQHIVSGIEAGWFPATASKPQYQFRVDCAYCQPDSLGTAERFSEWERKQHDDRLAAWFATAPDSTDPGVDP